MNEGFMEDPGPREPGIDPLIKLLTSEGTPDELAVRWRCSVLPAPPPTRPPAPPRTATPGQP